MSLSLLSLPQLFLLFIVLSAIIVVAGYYLAVFGDVIAERSGLGGSLVGLILIAAATSLPELVVNCGAVLLPVPATDMAVGAIVGSSLFNLLILGLMEFLHGTKHRIISPASRGHALSAIASIVVTSLLAFFVLVGDPSVGVRFGLGPIIIFLAYLFCIRLIYLDEKQKSHDNESELTSSLSLRSAVKGYLLTSAVIFVAAGLLAPTADQIADRSGLGGTFVGTIFVAITTSLPELVTTLVAVRIGAFNLAVGNVFGSNAFNAAMLLPIDAFYQPGPLLGAVSKDHAMTAAAVLLVTSVILLAMFYTPPKRRHAIIAIMDPSASLVVVLSLLGIAAVYFVSVVLPN